MLILWIVIASASLVFVAVAFPAAYRLHKLLQFERAAMEMVAALNRFAWTLNQNVAPSLDQFAKSLSRYNPRHARR